MEMNKTARKWVDIAEMAETNWTKMKQLEMCKIKCDLHDQEGGGLKQTKKSINITLMNSP